MSIAFKNIDLCICEIIFLQVRDLFYLSEYLHLYDIMITHLFKKLQATIIVQEKGRHRPGPISGPQASQNFLLQVDFDSIMTNVDNIDARFCLRLNCRCKADELAFLNLLSDTVRTIEYCTGWCHGGKDWLQCNSVFLD